MALAGVALASRAGLAEALISGFLEAGLGLATRVGSGEAAPAPPNFFTESATLVTVRLRNRRSESEGKVREGRGSVGGGKREGGDGKGRQGRGGRGKMEGGEGEGRWREGTERGGRGREGGWQDTPPLRKCNCPWL